jgi:hypothetical protein
VLVKPAKRRFAQIGSTWRLKVKQHVLTLCAIATLGALVTISGPVSASIANDVPLPRPNPIGVQSPINLEAQVARTCIDRYGLSFAAIACADGNVTLVEMLKCVDFGIGIPRECLNPNSSVSKPAQELNQTTDHPAPLTERKHYN